jgi:lysophospholipase L1-like esterase
MLAFSMVLVADVAVGQSAASPEIIAPGEGETVDQGLYTVRGHIGTAPSEDIWVVFAVDVSGSTLAAGFDCDGSGTVDAADDLNGDSQLGEVLDCQIAALIALNTSLAAIPGSVDRVHVAVVPFGSEATVADVGGSAGQQDFVAPTDDLDENDRDRTSDVVQVAASLDQASVALFDVRLVGSGTNFDAALTASLDLLDGKQGARVVFLLTDGDGPVAQATLDRIAAADVEVRPFAVGAATDGCASGGTLDRVAQAGGSECVFAADPASLTAEILDGPSSIVSVTVSLDGGSPIEASVDPLGNFAGEVFLSPGAHEVVVTVVYTDDTEASSSRRFTAETTTRIVAMGDSYTAGEGITPFADVPGSAQGCHQSTAGYPTLLGTPGFEIPGISSGVTLEYVACSGAVLPNLVAVPQNARGETHIVQATRLDASVDLAVFTIGGNDLGFAQVVTHCATQFDCWEDGFAPLTSGRVLSADEFLLARLVLFVPEAESFFATARERTGDNAAVVVMGYPELFDDGIALRFGCKEALVFERSERLWINDRARLFSETLAGAAGRSGVWFVDVVAEFQGHRVCDGGWNDNSEWIVGHETSAKMNGDASFHPNAQGAEAYARLLSGLLNDRAAEGGPLTPAGLPANPGVSSGQAETPYRPVTADSLPTLDELGLTSADVAEIAAMRFGLAEITGLSALREDATCSNLAAPGEQLIVEGAGFAPNSEVMLYLETSTEEGRRTATVVADALGRVDVSVIVPGDLPPDRSGEITGAVVIGLEGTDGETGGFRRVSEAFFVDTADGECAAFVRQAGDVSIDGGPAPSAAGTPGVPDVVALAGPLVVETCLATVDPNALNGEVIIGTSGDDVLVGTRRSDLIIGGGGDDRIFGRGGRDHICGGDGDDVIRGGNGGDVIDAGAGDDVVFGGNGKDVIYGSAGDDRLVGGRGADRLFGGPGDDRLWGGSGRDTLDGGDGHDTVRGGGGVDTCTLSELVRCEIG